MMVSIYSRLVCEEIMAQFDDENRPRPTLVQCIVVSHCFIQFHIVKSCVVVLLSVHLIHHRLSSLFAEMVVHSLHETSRKIITNSHNLVRLLIVLIFLFGFLLYAVDISSIVVPNAFKTRWIGNGPLPDDVWSSDFPRVYEDSVREQHRSYFVNTPGCRMPKFNVIDPSVKTYLRKENEIVCRKHQLIVSDQHSLWIAMNRSDIADVYGVENVEDMICYYQTFYRINDKQNEFSDVRYAIPYGDMVRVSDEFVRVTCTLNDAELYRDYHFFFPEHENVSTTTTDSHGEGDTTNDAEKYNVVVIGVDSVSRLNFHRQMNESASILLNQMHAIELFGYNKVADNTYPNLMPALGGLDEDEMQAACMPNKNDTFDQCHFIWDEYKRRNYTTMFAEDMAWIGLFNYFKNGFSRAPTDYYFRTFINECESNSGAQQEGNAYMCLGGQRTIDLFIAYMNKFLAYANDTNMLHFSFFWTSAYTHDFFNYPGLMDAVFAKFLRNYSTSRAINNTFLLVMSDHGLRFGSFRNTYQGMMEERQPFLYLIPPTNFARKYPVAMRNLVMNKHALTSHFDLYETLRDLYDLTTLTTTALKQRTEELREADPMPRGISLFLPIPTNRTCIAAGISSHWCTCHERQEIPKNDQRVVDAARKVINTMNELLEGHPLCQKLSLNSISDANLGVSNRAINNNTANNFADINVRLQTKPGFGEFEATVRVHDNGELNLTGSISRTNLYGKQSSCVDDYHLKLYCFCGPRL